MGGVYLILNIHTVQVESVLLVMQRNRKSLFLKLMEEVSVNIEFGALFELFVVNHPSMTKPRSYEALWLRFLCHMISFFFLILSVKCVVKLMETC